MTSKTDTFRAHVLHEPDTSSRELLESLVDPNVVLTYGDAMPAEPPELLVAGRPEPRHLDAAPGLRFLLIPWAGLPVATAETMRAYPHVAVHNSHHNACSAAELAFALALAAAKQLIPGDRELRRGDWSPRYEQGGIVRLDGARALILGYGAIGRSIAGFCRAFGMQVTGVRRGPGAGGGPDEVVGLDSLDSALAKADFLFVTLPLTPETEGLLDERRLGLLPPRAVLVNVGRGPVIDEEALYRALTSGTLGAAGLDVWYNYPRDRDSRGATPPSDFDFGALDNVVLSPHRGGAPGTDRTERERMEAVASSINAAARGESVPNPVDLVAGY